MTYVLFELPVNVSGEPNPSARAQVLHHQFQMGAVPRLGESVYLPLRPGKDLCVPVREVRWLPSRDTAVVLLGKKQEVRLTLAVYQQLLAAGWHLTGGTGCRTPSPCVHADAAWGGEGTLGCIVLHP